MAGPFFLEDLTRMKILPALFLLLLSTPATACPGAVTVCPQQAASSFALVRRGTPSAVIADRDADPAVRHAADGFAEDLERVSGRAAARADRPSAGPVVVIGVAGHSAILADLARRGKIDLTGLAGQWEAYRQVVVDRPFPGVARALVIIGSDRRGAVFGTYDLSEKIGVSPWHWFADVPTTHRENLFVTAGSRGDQPRVRYRGFFINDEDPAFNSWARKRFGGINAAMYAHVFDLLLRLKGNYLWPAMWAPKAFNDDDPQNKVLADRMGVVMGTSHHEPMTRAQDEWHRHTDRGVTGGKWDYASNAANLRAFWRGGIERMMSKGDGTPYESLVTIGMRGDGDEAMAEGTATELLEQIVADQRSIIADVTGKPAAETPQVWALYKEVQDYYDHGMRVPDDVILLFADDNWSQIRRLPTADLGRKGGYGVYYHFDYVGGPRNYKWLNTVQIEKSWQQMDLAYARGARALWIVNVGDIKPVEFPLSFFMKQAWDPEAMTLEAMTRFPEEWARATFGPAQAQAIAGLLTRYSQYAARRKPELIDADSFPLGAGADGGEFGALVAEWEALEAEMLRVKAGVPADRRDAYLQLLEHPIAAMANLYRLYYAVAWNRRLAAAGDPRANAYADQAEAVFARDQALTAAFHTANGGKWDGMMSQTHIGYSGWQQPEKQAMPAVRRVPAGEAVKAPAPVAAAGTAIAIEAPDYARVVDGAGLRWRVVPHLGRTSGAVIALPQGRPATAEQDGVRIEYDFTWPRSGALTAGLYLVPTLDVSGKGTLRFGVSLDDEPMRLIADSMVPAPTDTRSQAQRDWNKAVEDNARLIRTVFANVPAGRHTLKIWRIDDNVVLQKLVLSDGTPAPSYLGPPPRR
jgi:hypothetical protein